MDAPERLADRLVIEETAIGAEEVRNVLNGLRLQALQGNALDRGLLQNVDQVTELFQQMRHSLCDLLDLFADQGSAQFGRRVVFKGRQELADQIVRGRLILRQIEARCLIHWTPFHMYYYKR